MDGNSAKKAPVLDHLVSTNHAPKGQPAATPPSPIAAKAILSSTNDPSTNSMNPQTSTQQQIQQAIQPQINQSADPSQVGNTPQNRRTDKSQFEIELTKTVNKIMLEHFEYASEQIVSQVLSEVRARLPGQRKE